MISSGTLESVPIATIELDRSNLRIRKFLEMYGDAPTPEQIFFALGAGGDDEGGATSTTFEKLKNSILTNGGVIQPVILNRRPDSLSLEPEPGGGLVRRQSPCSDRCISAGIADLKQKPLLISRERVQPCAHVGRGGGLLIGHRQRVGQAVARRCCVNVPIGHVALLKIGHSEQDTQPRVLGLLLDDAEGAVELL